jgi:hypothetical protein
LRAPEPARSIATSTVEVDEAVAMAPSTRAKAAPQRTTSRSAAERWDEPLDSRTIASTSDVFPAAFGPQISWGPAENDASSSA